MAVKFILVCVQALALQSIAGQSFISRIGATPCNIEQWNTCAYPSAAPSASNGGSLPVSSASLYPPSGVSIVSENAYEGSLAVTGALPFLGTVALEGALPTAGSGAVAYGCGNGDVAMLTEDMGGAILNSPFGYPANAPGFGKNLAAPLPPFAPAALFAPATPFPRPATLPAAFGAPFPAPFPALIPAPFSALNPFLSAPFSAGLFPANAPLASPFALQPYGPAAAAASNGGALPVTSTSAIPPSGVNLLSDNNYEGALSVAGAMPFLGTVALEGALPTAGAGSISYGCGNGDITMLIEEFATGPAFAGLFNQMGCRYGI